MANKISADEITQPPIFEHRKPGSVRFHHSVSSDKIVTARAFLNDYKRERDDLAAKSGNIDKQDIKGEEYQNVAIVMEHNFGSRNQNKFKNYFDLIQKSELEIKSKLEDPEENHKHTNSRNLLYVACARAIKNLRILYLDDISEIKRGIGSVFEEISPWV